MPNIVGVEVAKTSILCCTVDSSQLPSDLAKFARSYTPVTLLSNISGLQTLLELGSHYVIEPTGDYSKIWIDLLQANEKTVLRVNPRRMAALKMLSGITSKTDRYDGAFLALYGAINYTNPEAFLSEYAEDLREAVLDHSFISRMAGNHQRRLWQLLAREWPEACRTANGTKPQQNRKFLASQPTGLWRFIAGEDIAPRFQAEREAQLSESIGCGLSELSRTLAAQVCEMERRQYPIEQRISQLLEKPEFEPYHKVFELFGFGVMTRASILARVFPFHQFLDVDGKPIRLVVPSTKSDRRHRRNKSLNAFRLALGNGTRLYQSGQLEKRKPAGPSQPRSALFLHVKSKIVIPSGKGFICGPHYLKQHADFYHSLPTKMAHKQKVMKTVGRVVKDLYRALLAGL
ncbi:transposase [Nodosilinea sp. LEGE 06152]|uniref:IS110 family transposase n=1 Tax=Nodosilinea sp. LEGE 06152 TaxID=2777966 RepID=UPI00187F61EE|nr:transposase [Nodosilinea sp. LEGE 06152]MBE9157677.1 transposase [Nodosilinea sp. LEGE 06152]